MADPVSLTTLIDDVLSNKDSPKDIRVEEALALLREAQTNYPEVYNELEKTVTLQKIPYSLENEKFIGILQGFTLRFATKLKRETEAPDGKTPDFLSTAFDLDTIRGATEVVEDHNGFRNLYKEKFVERLVDNWIDQLGKQRQTAELVDSREKRDALKNTAVSKLSPELSIDQNETEVSRRTLETTREMTRGFGNNGSAMAGAMREALSQGSAPEDVRAFNRAEDVDGQIQKAVLTADVRDARFFAETLRGLVADNPAADIKTLTARAVEKTRTIEALSAGFVQNVTDEQGNFIPESKAALVEFYRSFGKAGKGNILQPLGDVAVAVLGPETQFAVAQTLMGKSLKDTVNNKAVIDKHFGAGSYEGPLFKDIRAQVNASVTAHEKTAAAVRGHTLLARFGWLYPVDQNFALDILDAAVSSDKKTGALVKIAQNTRPPANFNAPVGTALSHIHTMEMQTHAAEFLSTVWLKSDGLFAYLRRNSPATMHFSLPGGLSNIGGWILSWGAGRAKGAAVRAAASWGAKTAIGKTIGGAIGSLIPIPIVGTVIGAVFGDAVLGKLFGGIKNIFGGLGNVLRFGHGGKQKWYDDYTSAPFVFLLVVSPIAVVFIISLLSISTILGSFAVTSPRQKSVGTGVSAAISYSGALPPPSSITMCPVNGASVTQTPYEAGTTHANTDALDLGINCGTPVKAAASGYIVGGCNSDPNLGNYVRIVSDNGSSAPYFLTYAHLTDCAASVNSAVPGNNTSGASATIIQAGDVIGYSGTTGNSTGCHLHFQDNGPTELTTQLPKSCGGVL